MGEPLGCCQRVGFPAMPWLESVCCVGWWKPHHETLWSGSSLAQLRWSCWHRRLPGTGKRSEECMSVQAQRWHFEITANRITKKGMTLTIHLWLKQELKPRSSRALGSRLIGLKGLSTGCKKGIKAEAAHSALAGTGHQLAGGPTARHQQGHPWCQLPGNTKFNPAWLECGEDLPGETDTKKIAHTPWARVIICAPMLFEVRL